MSRLIDADKLLEELRKYHPISYGIYHDIEYFPTAYDIDEVVNKLEDEATLSDVDGIGKCYAIDLQTAVIIVNKGGAE